MNNELRIIRKETRVVSDTYNLSGATDYIHKTIGQKCGFQTREHETEVGIYAAHVPAFSVQDPHTNLEM